jgi:DNA-binding Xre family transcriptional regulator
MSIEMRGMDDIRKDVKEVMATKNISARQIQRERGISQVTVNNFLKGRGKTYDQTVIKLCLHLSLTWYKGADHPTAPDTLAVVSK